MMNSRPCYTLQFTPEAAETYAGCFVGVITDYLEMEAEALGVPSWEVECGKSVQRAEPLTFVRAPKAFQCVAVCSQHVLSEMLFVDTGNRSTADCALINSRNIRRMVMQNVMFFIPPDSKFDVIMRVCAVNQPEWPLQ
jgi:hypothetical protein